MNRLKQQARAPRNIHSKNLLPAHEGLALANAAKRCGAKTRKGGACRAPAIKGQAKCRMHGGAKGTGAPFGNTNAYKHGAYTWDMKADRAFFRKLIREATHTIDLADD